MPQNSEMSHYEYCKNKNISKEVFNSLIRGYYLNGYVVFYKDNFVYDDDLIEKSLTYLKEISSVIDSNEFDIYFGQKPEDNFKLDFYYGKYIKNRIVK